MTMSYDNKKMLIILELLIKGKFRGTRNELIRKVNEEHSITNIKSVIKDLIKEKVLIKNGIKELNNIPYNIYELDHNSLMEFYTNTTTGMLSAYVIEEHHRKSITLFSVNGLVEDREQQIKEKYK